MRREQIIGLCALLAVTAAAVFWDARRPAGQTATPSGGEEVYAELLEAAAAAVEGEALPHVGYDSIFARSIGDEGYLVRYLPTMYQGWADYHLEVFSLDGTGGERLFYRNDIVWDCNFRMDGHQYDAEALADFLWDVRGYLEDSTLLLSTEDGTLRSNVPGLSLRYYPFGDTLALESREAVGEAVRRAEAEYRGEQGVA